MGKRAKLLKIKPAIVFWETLGIFTNAQNVTRVLVEDLSSRLLSGLGVSVRASAFSQTCWHKQ